MIELGLIKTLALSFILVYQTIKNTIISPIWVVIYI